jgi:hypothetical protein
MKKLLAVLVCFMFVGCASMSALLVPAYVCLKEKYPEAAAQYSILGLGEVLDAQDGYKYKIIREDNWMDTKFNAEFWLQYIDTEGGSAAFDGVPDFVVAIWRYTEDGVWGWQATGVEEAAEIMKSIKEKHEVSENWAD